MIVDVKKFVKTAGYITLSLGAISMLIPFIWMLLISFMMPEQIFHYPPKFIPHPFVIDSYKNVFNAIAIRQYFTNSMIVAFATTLGQVIISAMAGYAFARLKFKYKEPLFFLILITMMVPPQVNIIPLFFIMRELNWIDTYQALIVPGLFGGFGVFLMRQWFKSLPMEIEEAAKIDGCNHFVIFFKIALPLVMPGVVTLAIFTFITTWNSFMWPLIVTNSDAMRTLPIGLANFKGSFREITQWGELMAYSVICCIPVITIFLAGKKYFIDDMLGGSLKE
ncbi:MAG: carbohydrate ABC transporter permease [Candidatus Gastranaerophilales bacterium]|nr:carbohydrate ABC transporter permease [Candidatus Gastranaerophilales bacterium]